MGIIDNKDYTLGFTFLMEAVARGSKKDILLKSTV